MSDVNLSIWGSIPDGSERFSDEPEGKTMLFQESHRAVSCWCSMSTYITQRGIETEL